MNDRYVCYYTHFYNSPENNQNETRFKYYVTIILSSSLDLLLETIDYASYYRKKSSLRHYSIVL